ncbi:MAG: hypothetical protein K1X75_08575 [Leptospirales bacterium]|nr:hypothetical protein [Leptospirales bacterium]
MPRFRRGNWSASQRAAFILFAGLALIGPAESLWAETSSLQNLWTPAGYGSGANLEGTGFGFSTGFKELNNDYYLEVSPFLEIPLGGFAIGLQIPLEVLVVDRDPKEEGKTPSIRAGTFDDAYDYIKLIQYVRYGTHLYFDPDDSFNWSFFYGKMTDGWLGHRTVISQYVNNYDATVFRAGLMADINNTWGGLEYFSSDVWRQEVVGYRGYIRPVGIFISARNLLFADSGRRARAIALQSMPELNPELARTGGYFLQQHIPEQGRGGRLQQHLHGRVREDLRSRGVDPDHPDGSGSQAGGASGPGGNGGAGPANGSPGTQPRYEEVIDPITGERSVREVAPAAADEAAGSESDSNAWDASFWSRIAIGAFRISDIDAPLTLESDGSGNLVVDPDTLRPRGLSVETLTFEGYDAEFRLSPLRWMDLTPYADSIRIKDLDGSEGIHAGVNFELKLPLDINLSIKPEYREHSANYIPTYFDQFHVIERTVYDPTASGVSITKLKYLQSLDADGERVKGYFIDLRFDWLHTLVVQGNYQDYDGPDNSQIFIGIYLPGLWLFYFNGYYTKKDYDALADSFEFDDRSLAAAQLGLNLFAGFAVQVNFQRTWEWDETQSAYIAQDETTYGFGYSSNF